MNEQQRIERVCELATVLAEHRVEFRSVDEGLDLLGVHIQYVKFRAEAAEREVKQLRSILERSR